ncbi:hypothetical protein MM809_35135, partial [Klebsiella pneumoniae]|nr:hypothetical protein [Klebsiella pneumoniae]
ETKKILLLKGLLYKMKFPTFHLLEVSTGIDMMSNGLAHVVNEVNISVSEHLKRTHGYWK